MPPASVFGWRFALLAGVASLVAPGAFANCVTGGLTTTCNAAAPNPYGSTIGTGNVAAEDNRIVTIGAGATVQVGNLNAISLRDNALITVQNGGTVQNNATTNGGFYATGFNTIEFRDNGTLTVNQGGIVLSTGSYPTAEAVNVQGAGNTIINNGTIRASNNAAIWFENLTGLNTVVNNATGVIRADTGGNVIGSSGDAAVDFTNRGRVEGNLVFAGGNDTLHLFTGSVITGNFAAGAGFDTIDLSGTGIATLPGNMTEFEVLTKTDSGTWTLSGTITGLTVVTVEEGTLILTGTNTNFTGQIIIDPTGILEARAQSLPPSVTDNGLLRFNQPDTGTYAGPISGTGQVEKTGAGTTILSGTNTYSGGTIITQGTLAITRDAALGAAAGPLTFNGGTLRFDAGFNLSPSRAISINAPGGTIDTNGFATAIAQGITGAGGLTVTGAGSLTLTGANTYAGGTTISNGTLRLGDGGTTGSITGNVANNGTLAFNRSDIVTFAGVVSGTGAVRQDGSGTTILTAANTYAGGTTISAGTLQIGNGGTTGSIVGDVANSGTLVFDRSDTLAFAGVVSGSGAMRLIGTGTTILTGDSTYAGGTTITAGTLQLGNGGTTGSIQGDITNNATLAFDRSDTMTLPGAISGTGAVRQNGTGATVLTGDSTYTGGTTISAGALQLGDGGASGSITGDVTNNGALVFNRSDTATFAGTISGTGMVEQVGAGTTILTAASIYTGGTTISAGTLQLGNGGTTGSIQGDVLNNGTLVFNRSDVVNFAGTIAGSGAVRQDGSGTTVLVADNSYTGGTMISGGTLQLGNGGTSGGITGDVANDGTLVFNRSDAVVFAGTIAGSGAVRQAGTGTTILTADSTYTGGTTISAGTLQLGNGGTTGSIQGDIANSGTLVFNRADTLTFGGVISGTGAVRQDGSGTTVLTGGNTYGGATAVNAGILRAGAPGVFSPASAFAVAAGAGLDLAGQDQTVAGLGNAGLVSLRGAPGTTLTVAGNYTGQGGVLALNTYLGGDGSASDRLVIRGGTATGDTGIRITNIGGPGAQTIEGIRVVETQAGGTTAAGAFRLDTRAAAGAFEYQLFRGGNTSRDDWFLRSFLLNPPPSPEEPGTPDTPAIPLYRPEVALYAPIPAIARQMGLASLGTLHERVGEEENIRGLAGSSPYANGAWARSFGERSRNRWDGTVDARATGDLFGIQAGFDILRTQPYAGGHRDHAGVYVAYTNYNAPSVSGFALGVQNLRVGRLLMEGPSVGAYWTHFGPSGWYVDAVFQASWYDITARSDYGAGLSTNATGYTASLEAGYPIRFGTGGRWQVEPQAQIIYQSISVDRSRDTFSSVDWDEGSAWTGRLGARLQYTGRDTRGTLWQPYAKLNLWHAFSGTDRASFGSGAPIENRFGDTAVEAGAGVTARVNTNTSFYANAGYRWSVDGGRSRQSAVQGTIGIRINW
ncbi:MAG TPA: autotransporter outer membrane beta-barrel domain-containing protein [Roseomonas sp.]